MSPEAAAYLDKARQCLGYARINLTVDLGNDAGRNAYLAAFHAAQSLIFERTGKVAKTHQGVQAEFTRLTKDDPRLPAEVRRFLAQAYNLKAVADYELGPDSILPLERAEKAVADAEAFVDRVADLLTSSAEQRE
ncbi:HEPN domain-containing protein [Azospirillum brasilense]|uniref:HEPN domain-containing protein n=1 Tax=Azospirillum brasilense TaxID=192 RepID=UPI000E0B4EA2|nr:HEPN domain-containing protein [Azospirillum brasilense]